MCYALKFLAPAADSMYYHFKFLGVYSGLYVLHLKILTPAAGYLYIFFARIKKNISSTEGAERPECETEKNFRDLLIPPCFS